MPGMRYQPQGLMRLNMASPLARGLVFAAVPGGPELISGVFPTRIGNADLSMFEHGKAFKSPSNTTDGWYWILPPNHPIYSITTEDSSFILANRASGAVASNLFGIPYRAEGWTTPFYAWTLATSGSNATSGGYNYAPSASVRRTTTMAGFYTNGKTQAYGVTRSGGRARYYAGGVQVGADAAITAGSPDFVNRRPPVLFNRSSDSPAEGTTGQAAVVLVWNRELSPEEWKSVNDNPWQLFDNPLDDEILFVSAAAPATLTGTNGSQGNTGTSASITQAQNLAGTNGTQGNTGTAGAITQTQNLTGTNGAQANTGTAATVGQALALVGTNGSQGNTGTGGAITQALNLVGTNGQQGNTGTSDAATTNVQPRYARPEVDIAAGGWTASAGASLSAMLSEPSADAGTFISTTTPGAAGACEVKLNPVTPPAAKTGHVTRYQAWSDSGDGIIVRLMQGTVVIAEWTHPTLPLTPTVFAQRLSVAQATSITDYANLRHRFEAI